MIRDLEHNEIIVCFNPRIIKSYTEEVEMEEGCLSYPDLFLKVKRPDKIVVKYEDVDKKTHKLKLEGLASRVFQHEYYHMEGIDFTQRKDINN
jgi:peptide deformylase